MFIFVSKIVFDLFSWWSAYQGLSFGVQERENRGDDRQEAKTGYIKTPHSICLYFSFLLSSIFRDRFKNEKKNFKNFAIGGGGVACH